MIDLGEMSIFVAVVEKGSFVGASRKLGVPTSTVSRRIANLESRLGARLLHRTTRRVSTTDVGAAYYRRCASIVAEAQEADASVHSAQATPTGRLRISVSVLFAERFLGPLLFEYMRTYPEVDVEVLVTDEIVDLVAKEVDVAVRTGQFVDARLVARKLGGPAPVYLYASPGYLQRRPPIGSIEDLANHECILQGGRSGRWTLDGPKGPSGVTVRGRFAANSPTLAREAALAGLGIARVPAFLCTDDVRAGALRVVLPEINWNPGTLYAVYVSKEYLPAKLRTFLDLLGDKLSPSPWGVP